MEQRVVDYFNSQIEATMSLGESLVDPIVNSANVLVEALLAGGKVFTCGNGISATLASTLNLILLNQFRIERPGFASICLSSDAAVSTGLTQQTNFSELYQRQIRTLAQKGDVLVLFSANSNSGNLIQAIQTAHEKEMFIIAFTGKMDDNVSALLTGADLELKIDHQDPFQVHSIQLLSLLSLCDLLEYQLFGG